jgi:hypothetical protein
VTNVTGVTKQNVADPEIRKNLSEFLVDRFYGNDGKTIANKGIQGFFIALI